MTSDSGNEGNARLRDVLLARDGSAVLALLAATPAAALVAFAAPSGWTPSVGDLVRLTPNKKRREMWGLRVGEFATVVTAFNNKFFLARAAGYGDGGGDEFEGWFELCDVQHALGGWLPLHAASNHSIDLGFYVWCLRVGETGVWAL